MTHTEESVRPCGHSIGREGRHLKLTVHCRECGDSATLDNSRCLSSVLKILDEDANIDEVVLSHYMESMYHGDAVTLLRKITSIMQEMGQLALRDPQVEYFSGRKGGCVSCALRPAGLFRGISDALSTGPGAFYDALGATFQALATARMELPECSRCIGASKNDLVFAFNSADGLRSFILYRGFQVVSDANKIADAGTIPQALSQVEAGTLSRGTLRIFERNRKIRPCFSFSWVLPSSPEKEDVIASYPVGTASATIFQSPGTSDVTYSLIPDEYRLPLHHVRLIQLAKDRLSEHYPRNIDIERSDQARNYILQLGRKEIQRIARAEGLTLGKSRDDELRTVKSLAGVLARYTAGLGLAEYLLNDPNINDVYMDSPVSENRIHVTMSIPDNRINGRCTTNITLSEDEAESLVSRFRYESGKPFSEAMPVLETDLQHLNTRVTVIGKPLSPEGIAIALRRHSPEPWTLPRLIYNRMMDPVAAGLLSFLIDGHSTILVAGSRGAGKTSLLGALMLELPLNQRILTIEDTLELPSARMQKLGYKVQSIQVQSSLGGKSMMTADEALRVSLRLGESVIVMGEVRGQEAKTLYEAMRAGTAGSSVLGTFHADSPQAVYQRVVFDMGIPASSFMATDIVVISSLTQPGGSMMQVRRVGQISETLKEEPGKFSDLMRYDTGTDSLTETDTLKYGSQKIGTIARAWGLTMEQAMQNIGARAKYRGKIVEHARASRNLNLLNAEWVAKTNSAWRRIVDGKAPGDYDSALAEWESWFEKAARFA